MTRIPRDPEGYSVTSDGTVHTRYSSHSKGAKVRTVVGAKAVLGDTKPRICAECYPVSTREKPKVTQQRRTP